MYNKKILKKKHKKKFFLKRRHSQASSFLSIENESVIMLPKLVALYI